MVEKVRRNKFAMNFKAQRINAGLNQNALAKLLGIAQPAVARYESGVREPDLDDLMAIAEKLGTTPNDLLGFDQALRDSASPREITTGDIKGNSAPVVVGSNNTVVSPPSSSSSSTAKKGKKK